LLENFITSKLIFFRCTGTNWVKTRLAAANISRVSIRVTEFRPNERFGGHSGPSSDVVWLPCKICLRCVEICRVPKNFVRSCPSPFVSAEASILNICLFPKRVTMPSLVVLGQTVRAYGNPPENWTFTSCLSRSLKVTETDTDRSATYDFLLVIHSNYGHLSYHFGDKRRFWWKLAFFLPTPPLTGFSLKFCNGDGVQKTYSDASGRRSKFFDNKCVPLYTASQRDGQTWHVNIARSACRCWRVIKIKQLSRKISRSSFGDCWRVETTVICTTIRILSCRGKLVCRLCR